MCHLGVELDGVNLPAIVGNNGCRAVRGRSDGLKSVGELSAAFAQPHPDCGRVGDLFEERVFFLFNRELFQQIAALFT